MLPFLGTDTLGQLEAVTGAVSDAIVTADTEGRITGWMGGAEALFGFTVEEALGRPLADLVPDGLRSAHATRYAAVAAGAPPKLIGAGPIPLEALRADGTTVPVELTLGRGESPDGAFFVGVLRDVTARREAEQHLHVAQERFTNAFEFAPIGMTMAMPDGSIMRANRAFCALLDRDPVDITDRHWSEFTVAEDVAAEEAARTRLLTGQSLREQLEKRFVHASGRPVWVELSIGLLRDTEGRPLHFIGQIRDIDDARRAKAELERSNRELEDLAAVASHDLRVPLSTVAGLLELLRRRQGHHLEREGLELVTHAADAVGRMQVLIEAVMRLARVDDGAAVQRRPIDLHELAEEAVASLDEGAEAVVLRSLPVVHGDPALVGQVLQNLLVNAVRHANAAHPEVVVSAERTKDAWCVSVADNGTGVAPGERERIFERFHRGDRHGAAGLGLSICRRAVDRLGGRIWVQEGPAGGADVRFTLPGREG